MGCGATSYREGKWFSTLYTCNYGPNGNFIRAKMYRQGRSSSITPKANLRRSELLSLPHRHLLLLHLPRPLWWGLPHTIKKLMAITPSFEHNKSHTIPYYKENNKKNNNTKDNKENNNTTNCHKKTYQKADNKENNTPTNFSSRDKCC